MNRSWFCIAVVVIVATLLLIASSCARNQHLVAIQVVPPGATFGGIGAKIKFRAIGTYIHPPATKDITAQAQWSIDSQNLVKFNGPGDVTSINDCGSGNVIATMQDSGNSLFGTAFVTAAGVGTSACNQAALTVIASGNGIVTSSPSGITCPGGACAATFPLDSTVVLSGAPGAGASFVAWSWPVGTAGCQSETSTTCTVVLLTNQTITATFR